MCRVCVCGMCIVCSKGFLEDICVTCIYCICGEGVCVVFVVQMMYVFVLPFAMSSV